VIELNEQQRFAVDQAIDGKNLFITGSGGVGKSVVINELRSRLRSSAVLLAPTGIAALNIEGATLHRTFGLPFSIAHEDDWRPFGTTTDLFSDDVVQTIIIDEISMVRADYFVAIDKKLRKVKGFNLPFGGLQVILVGDFFQLPPVLTRKDEDIYHELFDSIFCFNTDAWVDLDPILIDLSQVMRQDDYATVRALNAIRVGKQAPSILQWINRKCADTEVSEDAVTLCTTNATASGINALFYDRNTNPELNFTAKITGTFNDRPVDQQLNIKKGCKVVICANNNANGYSNGQSGEILDHIAGEMSYINVKLDNGSIVKVECHVWESFSYKIVNRRLTKMVIGTYSQFPLKMGYGITIHKSQGMTLDECILDLGSGAFSHGQTYVALSRIRSLDNLFLESDIQQSDLIVDQEVIDFYKQLEY